MMEECRVTTRLMNEIVASFTLNQRPWPAFSADRIEVMARWWGAVPKEAIYKGFDADTDELIFVRSFYVDDPYVKIPWWKKWWVHRRIKKWYRRIFN